MCIYIYLSFCIARKTLTAFSDLPLDNLHQYAGLWNILFWGWYIQVEKNQNKPKSVTTLKQLQKELLSL